MALNAFAKGFQMIATLQGGHDATFAMFIGKMNYFISNPGEIVLRQIDLSEGIEFVRVETCRDEYYFGLVMFNRW